MQLAGLICRTSCLYKFMPFAFKLPLPTSNNLCLIFSFALANFEIQNWKAIKCTKIVCLKYTLSFIIYFNKNDLIRSDKR